MATRTAYAGTAVAGDAYTAANHARMPGGWIGDVSVTSSQSGISTETDLTGLTVTVTAGSNRRLMITAQVNLIGNLGGTGNTVLAIKESSTYLGAAEYGLTGGPSPCSVCLVATLTPSAGSHTYKLTLQRAVGGSGTVATSQGANIPARLIVEDVGPAS